MMTSTKPHPRFRALVEQLACATLFCLVSVVANATLIVEDFRFELGAGGIGLFTVDGAIDPITGQDDFLEVSVFETDSTGFEFQVGGFGSAIMLGGPGPFQIAVLNAFNPSSPLRVVLESFILDGISGTELSRTIVADLRALFVSIQSDSAVADAEAEVVIDIGQVDSLDASVELFAAGGSIGTFGIGSSAAPGDGVVFDVDGNAQLTALVDLTDFEDFVDIHARITAPDGFLTDDFARLALMQPPPTQVSEPSALVLFFLGIVAMAATSLARHRPF